MAAFFNVHLKQISQIVERWRRMPEQALLFHGGWFRVTLCHDQPTQGRTMFARHLLPHRLSEIVAKSDSPVSSWFCEKNSPAIFRHFHVAERRPAFGIHGNRCSQINL